MRETASHRKRYIVAANGIAPNDGQLATAYENALLGFMLYDPDKMLEVAEILPAPEYFTQPRNRTAWEIFLKLFQADTFPGSPALMIGELHTRAKAQFPTEAEAAAYVNMILDAPTTGAKKFNPKSFVEYAEHIKWEHDKKKLVTLADEIKGAAAATSVMDREEFVGGIEDRIAEITMSVHGKDSLMHISDITESLEDQLARLRRGEKLGGGVMTGIDMLDKTLNGLKGGEMCVLAGRPAMGKPVISTTPMTCYNADDNTVYIKPICELEVGDYVYNRHGKPVEVLGVYPQGKLDAYRMTFSDGREAISGIGHIWPYWQRTHKNGKSVEKIFTKTLQEMLDKGIYVIKPNEKDDPTRRNRSRFAMPINEPVEFPAREHKISPYVMGAFLGDGCKNDSASFVLSSAFEYHVAQIAEKLGATGYSKSKGCYSWYFYKDPKKTHYLRIFDVDPTYTALLSDTYCGDKYIPEEYLLDSIENRWELLRGLMDTDGSIAKESWRHPLSFGTTSKRLAQDFRSLCNSLGLIAHIKENDRRGKEHVASGKTYIRKSVEYEVSILCPNELKPKFFTLKHKLERAYLAAEHEAARGAKYDRIQLKKVEKLPKKQDMVCIMVDDPEHLFLCNDYLVTHNTTLSMQITQNVAKTKNAEGKPNAVLIFSLEMMEDQLMTRMVATCGRVNMKSFMEEYEHFIDDHYYARAYSPNFEEKMRQKLDTQYQRIQYALKHIKEMPIYTSTEAGMSPNSIKSLVMQKKREIEKKGENLALVVIDYLQLMVPAMSKSNASRTEEVGDMSRKMKLLAKEFDVPVLLLAQLNRNADVTERPNLKDLRESGSIEQDADKVMFIWSENADKSAKDFAELCDDAARMEALRREQMKVTITVAKNRQGESGDCPVIFDKGFQTFVSQSDEYAANNEQYEEFAAKYYQKTRTTDLFWPLKPGEIPEEFEAFRNPTIKEAPYLTSDNRLITMTNAEGTPQGSMTIQSNPITPANQSTNPAGSLYEEPTGAADRIVPSQPPVIDDLETGFEELDDEEEVEEELVVEMEGANDIADDPDDEDIDLDALDMLEALSNELDG